MFKYTKASVDLLVKNIKKIAKVFRYLSMVFTIGFLIFQIILGIGIFEIKIGLLAAFILFTILDIIFEKLEFKTARKIAKRIYKWLKIIVKLFTLIITIIEIYKAEPTSINGVSIILATIMIVLWIVSFVAEILVEVITDRCEELFVAWKKDVDDISKPISTVKNVYNKVTGQEENVTSKRTEKIINKLRNHINKKKDN